MKLRALIVSAACLFFAGSAYATTYSEGPGSGNGDAGSWPVGAHLLPDGTDLITGQLGWASGGEDMFRFNWAGGLFVAESLLSNCCDGGEVADTPDSMLHLFAGDRTFITTDDDSGSQFLASKISENLAAGAYYLAITSFYNTPILNLNNKFNGWTNNGFSDFNYEIALNAPTGIPEPGTLALLGLGLLGFGVRKVRS